MKRTLCLILILFSTKISSFEHFLTVCAIFQNESPYLDEWIEYHKSFGVEFFLLYNNNSTDDSLKTLQKYIDQGLVEVINWPSIEEKNDAVHFIYTVQIGAYNDALERLKSKTKWCAFIDVDEFIVPIGYESISLLLFAKFSDVAGLCVNWQCYGTSNVERCTSVLDELVYKMKWDHPWNRHSKMIVRPSKTISFPNPHFCKYIDGYYAVDATHKRCYICPDGVYIDKIRINHYWTRDKWFFNNFKIPRWKKWGNSEETILDHAKEMNQEYDPILSNTCR